MKRSHGYTAAAAFIALGAFALVGSVGTPFGSLFSKGERRSHSVLQLYGTSRALSFEYSGKIIGATSDTLSNTPFARGSADTARRASILFVGDIMLDRNVAKRMQASKDVNYPFAKLPAGFLTSLDQTVGNLEGPVGMRRLSPVKSIDFLFSPSVLPVLQEQGFDVFSQANNHGLDQGAAGFTESVRLLREAGFLVFGHQVKDDSIALATTTVGGFKLAYLGYNTTDNALDRKAAGPVIAQAAAESDFVIAYVHWGNEYRKKPDASSVETARWLIDQGVDIVIGGHPHWTQGFSTYKGKLIAWSLGNFIFDQDWSEETREGLALGIELSSDKIAFDLKPVRIKNSQPRLLDRNELMERLKYLSEISDKNLAEAVRSGRLEFNLAFKEKPE